MKWIGALVGAFLLVPMPSFGLEGALYLDPPRARYELGDTFEVAIYGDTAGAFITAGEVELRFNPEQLEVRDVRTENSIFSTWATEPMVLDGILRLSGWVGGPAYKGVRGPIATIEFEALQTGAGDIELVAGSLLSRDSAGSNIVSELRYASYRVEPRSVAAIDELEPLKQVAGASISPPSITALEPMLSEGEKLIVKGMAEPSSALVVAYARGDEMPVRAALYSGPDGSFTFASDTGLQAGSYRIWVEMERPDAALRSEHASVLVAAAHQAQPYQSWILWSFVGAGLLGVLFLARRRKKDGEIGE